MSTFGVTAHVRALAEKHGVTERTIWRWFKKMRDTTSTALLAPRLCAHCEHPLPVTSSQSREYCSGAHRVAAHRQRKRDRRA